MTEEKKVHVHGTASNLPGSPHKQRRYSEAITNAPPTRNVSELKSCLGMINYYKKFLPNLSSVLALLHRLLNSKTHWHWGKDQQQAFEQSKSFLKSSRLVVHYHDKKELILACDASQNGLGCGPLTQDGGWFRTSYLLCIPNLDKGKEELFKFTARSASSYIWREEIPSISVWPTVHPRD